MSSVKIKKCMVSAILHSWIFSQTTVYRRPSLSACIWFQKKRVLSETALSKGTLSIRITVHRSNLYTRLILQ
jgi:hypothetical protein